MPLEWMTALWLGFLLLSMVGTKLLIRLLSRTQVVDNPNARSNHTMPTPRGAGVVTVLLLLLAFGVFNLIFPENAQAIWPVASGISLLAAIGFVDDIKGVAARWRLLLQLIAVSLVLLSGSLPGLVFQGFFPFWLDRLLTGFLWLWFINLYNFMDGIDGITAMETISIALGIGLTAYGVVLTDPSFQYAWLIIALMLGFLRYNWHPAKIFLGDVGSVPLGFMLGWLLILLAMDGYWATALILPAYYLGDSSITLIRRLLKKERIWEAHSQHFYQQAVRRGLSHRRVVGYIMLCNIALLVASIAALFPQLKTGMIAIAGTSVLLLLYALKAKRHKP